MTKYPVFVDRSMNIQLDVGVTAALVHLYTVFPHCILLYRKTKDRLSPKLDNIKQFLNLEFRHKGDNRNDMRHIICMIMSSKLGMYV